MPELLVRQVREMILQYENLVDEIDEIHIYETDETDEPLIVEVLIDVDDAHIIEIDEVDINDETHTIEIDEYEDVVVEAIQLLDDENDEILCSEIDEYDEATLFDDVVYIEMPIAEEFELIIVVPTEELGDEYIDYDCLHIIYAILDVFLEDDEMLEPHQIEQKYMWHIIHSVILEVSNVDDERELLLEKLDSYVLMLFNIAKQK